MDKLSLFGALIVFLAVLFGVFLEGGSLGNFYNSSALLIVLGGTVGTVLLQTPSITFNGALKLLPWIYRSPASNLSENIEKVTLWSQQISQEGVLSLQESIELELDTLSRKGLELLLEGGESKSIRSVLETDLYVRESQQLLAAKVYSSMGGYAPTIGIIGAVVGLIKVMGNLAQPEILGEGIATAFVATIYGVAFANFVFLPVGNKLKAIILNRTSEAEIIIDGIVAIAEGEQTSMLERRLDGYLNRFDSVMAKAS